MLASITFFPLAITTKAHAGWRILSRRVHYRERNLLERTDRADGFALVVPAVGALAAPHDGTFASPVADFQFRLAVVRLQYQPPTF
jgi:hypothetical protein